MVLQHSHDLSENRMLNKNLSKTFLQICDNESQVFSGTLFEDKLKLLAVCWLSVGRLSVVC